MDEDDEFGDLYTDVICSSSSSAAAAAAAADRVPIEVSPSPPPKTLAPAAAADELGGGGEEEEEDDDWLLGRAPPAVEAPANWDDDEEDETSTRPADAAGSYVRNGSEPRVLEKGSAGGGARVSQIPEGNADLMEEDEGIRVQEEGGGGGGAGEDQVLKGKIEESADGGDLDQVPAIPGLSSGPPAPAQFLGRDPKPSGSEDWDSDSEDDLQIVLNDDNYGMLGGQDERGGGMEDGDEDEDGEEDLVIVTDEDHLHHHHLPATEEQDWGEEGMQAGGDGERKEGGDGAQKGSGAGGAAASARIGYSNHSIHAPPHHSMFKYVRPGAGPISGGTVGGAVGPQGQIRPPLPSGPLAGRGRGDWRPPLGRGIGNSQKGFYPIAPWNNSSARALGSGLDFTLPPHKTVFDFEIDSFEEKPWRYPGADISDFFNFGLDEDKWKDYCKQLEQMRLEATMQSKIRVYESGRSEQEYDPDLPPELAAAAGYHDISTDNGRLSKADNGQIDVNSQGRGPANVRPPLPTGRAIQVEGGYGERLPSIDTRPPRVRDSDAIIEIVLQDSMNDPVMSNGGLEQPEKDFQGERTKDSYEVKEDERNEALEYMDHGNASTNRRVPTRRAPFSSEGGDDTLIPSEVQDQYPPPNFKAKSPVNGGASGALRGGRLPQQTSTGRHSTSSGRKSNDAIRTQPTNSEGQDDRQDDRQRVDSSEINETSEVSPTIEDRFDENEDKLELHDSIEAGDDINSDIHVSSETLGEDNDLAQSGKKSKLSSQVENSSAYHNDDEDMQRTSHSENSRAKSGSSREYQKRPELGEEVVQDGRSRRLSDSKRRREGEERNFRRVDDQQHERSRIAPKGREDMYHPYAHRDSDRGRSFETVREADIWQRREEALHGRRAKDEDIRREQSLEAGMRHRNKARASDRTERDEDLHKKRVDDREWRGSRPRERDDILMNRRETLDDLHTKRKKDEESSRRVKSEKEDLSHRAKEDSSRRKRERDDVVDQRKREDNTRIREKGEDYYPTKHKDDSLHHREREDRQRSKQPHESTSTHREREDGRGAVRSGRAGEDKLFGSSRNKEDLKPVGDKIYQDKERRRQNESSKRDPIGEENSMQHKGRDERISRHDRVSSHNYHSSSGSGGHHMYIEQKEAMRKGKSSEPSEQNSQRPGKRRHQDHSAHQNEKGDIKGQTDHESIPPSKKNRAETREQPGDRPLLKQGEEEPASDDDNIEDSRRGRSKLERWTSHKERDYTTAEATKAFATSVRAKEVETLNTDELGRTEANDNNAGSSNPNPNAKSGDLGQVMEKVAEDRDRHLDTVAKLKKRSERFKLPMPGEKETTQNKVVENEMPKPQNEGVAPEVEVKPERPARKRRWTGS